LKEDEKMAQIPDALQAAPNVYKLLMENDRVRVLDVRVKPGEKTKMHSHPDRVVYVLSDHRLKFTSAEGQTKELELKAGQVLWIEAGAHTTENIGKNEAHNIAVELKE
jgi:quercetin dioxygenase-like cupin family protein